MHWYLRTYVDVYASADSLGGLDGGVCEILMDGTMAVEGA